MTAHKVIIRELRAWCGRPPVIGRSRPAARQSAAELIVRLRATQRAMVASGLAVGPVRGYALRGRENPARTL
jgi:hypothetical protein